MLLNKFNIIKKKINPNIAVLVIIIVVVAVASNVCGFCIMKGIFQ